MTQINVAEQFYSVQGEGPHAGVPSIFLRLAGCNLVCGGRENASRDPEKMKPEGDATWVCDTIDVWREAERSPEAEELVEEWKDRGWLQSLREGAHLVLTGGEPMMEHNQEAFVSLMAELLREDVSPFVEVETNGTIVPDESVAPYIDQYNVSLKLSNSGMEREERINEDALLFYRVVEEEGRDKKGYGADATLKFVVSKEADVVEIEDLVEEFELPPSMISLMPAGQTQEQLRETYPIVAEMCKMKGWRFSPRLQVDAWNEATGV